MQYGTGPTTVQVFDVGLLVFTHKCVGILAWFAPRRRALSERAIIPRWRRNTPIPHQRRNNPSSTTPSRGKTKIQ